MNVPNPKITTGGLPASGKIYVEGTLHDGVRVPMREISVHPTAGEPPLPVYDSSGPYTDPDILTDIQTQLFNRAAELREQHTVHLDNEKDFRAFFTPQNPDQPEIFGWKVA